MTEMEAQKHLVSALRALTQFANAQGGCEGTMTTAVLAILAKALQEGVTSPAWVCIVGEPEIFHAVAAVAEYEGCRPPEACCTTAFDRWVVEMLHREGGEGVRDIIEEAVQQALRAEKIALEEVEEVDDADYY